VNIQLVGEAPGSKVGGVIQQVTREIRVEALPALIPEHIEADMSGLEVGEILRLEDLPTIEGLSYLDDPHETVLATCSLPRGLTEAEEAAEAEEGEGEAAADGDAAAAAEGAADETASED
jgi:large subunit ribosomal protein L25